MYPSLERSISTLIDEEECGAGVHGLVFRAGSYAVKLFRSLNEENKHYLPKKESIYAEALFTAGIAVPRPHGLFRVPGISPKGYLHSLGAPLAYVCDFIQGVELDEVHKYVIKLRDIEVEKALELGFSATDARKAANALYDGERVYLIDFCNWSSESGTPSADLRKAAYKNQKFFSRLSQRFHQGLW